jgi:hypothetical protein
MRHFRRMFRTATVTTALLLLFGCQDDLVHTPLFMGADIPLAVTATQLGQDFSFTASGAITDHGLVEGSRIVGQGELEWNGYRVLHGMKGDVSISVKDLVTSGGPFSAEGTYTIVGGTGRYATVRGCGLYRSNVDSEGRLHETYEGCCDGKFSPAEPAQERPGIDPQ